MIAAHAAVAQSLADQLELPADVGEAVGCAYEHWDGHGWPGRVRGAEIPLAARIAQLAEFVEVAYRIGGVDARADARAAAPRQAVRPGPGHARRRRCGGHSRRARRRPDVGRGDRRRTGARHLAHRRADRRGAARDRRLRRPEVAVHARPRGRRRAARRGRGARARLAGSARCGRFGGRRSCTTSAGSASRTRSGTSPARSAQASGNACGSART